MTSVVVVAPAEHDRQHPSGAVRMPSPLSPAAGRGHIGLGSIHWPLSVSQRHFTADQGTMLVYDFDFSLASADTFFSTPLTSLQPIEAKLAAVLKLTDVPFRFYNANVATLRMSLLAGAQYVMIHVLLAGTCSSVIFAPAASVESVPTSTPTWLSGFVSIRITSKRRTCRP